MNLTSQNITRALTGFSTDCSEVTCHGICCDKQLMPFCLELNHLRLASFCLHLNASQNKQNELFACHKLKLKYLHSCLSLNQTGMFSEKHAEWK